MRYTWIDDYLLSKKAVTKDLQKDWNWIRYKIGDKMFAAVLLDDSDKPYYVNFKLDPEEGAALRDRYDGMIPGYYSDKRCWNSVKADGDFPDELLKKLLDKSYALVLSGFAKKKQREILSLTVCGTDCNACPLYKTQCVGCNEACGKVFHTGGKACAIYACCANKKRFVTCGECESMPCGIWRTTRDPSMTDEQFENSINERVNNLK